MKHHNWPILFVLALIVVSPTTLHAQNTTKPKKDDRSVLLPTVGLLATSQVYQAYLNIGFLAEGKAEGLYKDQQAHLILDTLLKLLTATDKQLQKTGQLDLTKTDRQALTYIRHISSLVRQQAVELKAYWQTGNNDRWTRYQQLRTQSATGISRLLRAK